MITMGRDEVRSSLSLSLGSRSGRDETRYPISSPRLLSQGAPYSMQTFIDTITVVIFTVTCISTHTYMHVI